MTIPALTTEDILYDTVRGLGFLPYFASRIPGFSIEDHTPWEQWMGDEFGPWDWKGPLLRRGGCVYGKFFGNKAGFISAEWFPDFANVRRDGYDFDARFDDGLASFREKTLYELVRDNGPILSKGLKALGNYRKGGRTGFEGLITRLQMQAYVVICDFEYLKDRHGKPYGWGVGKYATPECFLGAAFSDAVYRRTPEESRERILKHLKQLFPDASDAALTKFVG